MSLTRTRLFNEIHDKVYGEYSRTDAEGESYPETHWRRTYGARWRNRVGIPRLVAEEAMHGASGLVRSINPGLFRNDPDTLALLRAAQAATDELATQLGRQNWRRFNGEADE